MIRKILLAVFLAAFAAPSFAADIYFDTDFIETNRCPSCNSDKSWALAKAVNNQILANDDDSSEATLWVPVDKHNKSFIAGYVTMTYLASGLSDDVAVTVYDEDGDVTAEVTLGPNAVSQLQEWSWPGRIKEIRFVQQDTGTQIPIHIQAW